jgi:hypothetical protein
MKYVLFYNWATFTCWFRDGLGSRCRHLALGVSKSLQYPPRLAPSNMKTAPMVRATGLELGPSHGEGRVAGGALEILGSPPCPAY